MYKGKAQTVQLNSPSGVYGAKSWVYDGVGNRTSETNAGVLDTYNYPATSNKLTSVVRNAVTTRAFTYDGAGNIATDNRSGTTFTYAYNNANRLKTVTQAANLTGTYTYNGLEQLISRVITNSGTGNGTTFCLALRMPTSIRAATYSLKIWPSRSARWQSVRNCGATQSK